MGLDPVELFLNMSILVQIITVGMIGMSIFMVYVIAERLLAYSAASGQSIRYVQALGEYLRQHKVGDALNAARSMPKSPVAKVMESGLTALIQGREALKTEGPDDVGDFDLVDSVNRARSSASKSARPRTCARGSRISARSPSATPFIGLLGTVIGILGTFQLLKGGSVAINAIGPKISEALVSTALGLAADRDHRGDVVQLLLRRKRRAVRHRHERRVERVHRLRAARGSGLRTPCLTPARAKRRWRLSGHAKAHIDVVRNDINVTPLVDVMLVLLIIFMLMVLLTGRGYDVTLPAAKNFSQEEDKLQPVVGRFDNKGILYVEKTPLGPSKSEAALKEMELQINAAWAAPKNPEGVGRVYLKADGEISYDLVYPVLTYLNTKMGVQAIDLAVAKAQTGDK